jgi:hypothetical protein
MLRNSASGPEIGLPGRISAGFYSGKHQSPGGRRPAGGLILMFPRRHPARKFEAHLVDLLKTDPHAKRTGQF